jgi:hypothetical protein
MEQWRRSSRYVEEIHKQEYVHLLKYYSIGIIYPRC